MPTIGWAFLCDYSFVDAVGKPSIIGMFESIGAASLPLVHVQLYVALKLKVVAGESFVISSSISAPSGREISKLDSSKIGSSPTNRDLVINFGYFTVEFTEPGEHHIEIFINGNSVHFIPLMVNLAKRRLQHIPALSN